MAWKKRRYFANIAVSAYHVILKEVENNIVRHNWQSCRIIIFLYKYYKVTSDTLLDFFLDLLFLLLAVIFSELHEKLRKKDRVTEKSTKKNVCEGHHFHDCTPSFLCHFLSFLSLPLPRSQLTYLLNGPFKDTQYC